jgi:hypothetical protein
VRKVGESEASGTGVGRGRGDGWRRRDASKRETPREWASEEGKLQNADADAASARAATVPHFASF